MGNCNINRCCKDFAEFIKIEENEDLKIIQPNSIKKGAYNDKILSKKYHEILNEIRENPSKYINKLIFHIKLIIFYFQKTRKNNN